MYLLRLINRLIEFILTCFIRGVLLFAPFLLTTYIVTWVLGLSKEVLGLGLNNYYILGIILFVILCGYFTKNIFIKCLYNLMEIVVLRIPGINFIYTSFKDLTSAFIDKKLKFDRPVLININTVGKDDIKKIGFITNDISEIGDNGEVPVFIPQSFSLILSGELLLVPKKHITELKDEDAKEILKYVISAGFIDIKLKKINK